MGHNTGALSTIITRIHRKALVIQDAIQSYH
jgi:hypothetical protein